MRPLARRGLGPMVYGPTALWSCTQGRADDGVACESGGLAKDVAWVGRSEALFNTVPCNLRGSMLGGCTMSCLGGWYRTLMGPLTQLEGIQVERLADARRGGRASRTVSPRNRVGRLAVVMLARHSPARLLRKSRRRGPRARRPRCFLRSDTRTRYGQALL